MKSTSSFFHICYYDINKTKGGKKLKRLILIILIISLSLVCLALSIELNAYNKNFYIKSYDRYGIEEVTNKSMDQLSKVTDGIISYLKNQGGDELLEPYFNEREILHMRDVQWLFNLARWIKWIGILVSLGILLYFKRKKEHNLLGKTVSLGLFSNHILLGILAILATRDFNKYFTYFHLIFFRNDLWILDPRTDLMIQMLPEEFFMNMAANIMLSFFVLLAIIQLIGYLFIKKGKIKNERNPK